MPVSDWNQSEDWDVLRLGGQVVPGIARVDVDLGSGLDVKKPKGGSGATIHDQGTPPATLKITVELHHEGMGQQNEVEEFQSKIIPLLRPRSRNGARDPLEIQHPQAALWGVHVVTIGDISSPMPGRGGTYIVSFTAIEWAPAPVKTKQAKKNPTGDAGHGKSARVLNDELESRPSNPDVCADNFSSPDQNMSVDPDAL
jgi:hypothetical protein